jgi:hypothetical protein
MLGALNIGRCIKGYSDVLSLDIVPSKSFTRHELPALRRTALVDGHMEKKLANVQEAMYSLVELRELLTVTSEYGPLFFKKRYKKNLLFEIFEKIMKFSIKINHKI